MSFETCQLLVLLTVLYVTLLENASQYPSGNDSVVGSVVLENTILQWYNTVLGHVFSV